MDLDAGELSLPAVQVRQPAVAQDDIAEGETGHMVGRQRDAAQL
jgi:hypothetical protein